MEDIKLKLSRDDLLWEEFLEILLEFKNVLKLEQQDLEDKIQEIVNLFFRNWDRFGKLPKELKSMAIDSFEILNTLKYEWEMALFSQESLKYLKKIHEFSFDATKDITQPEFWISFNLRQAVQLLQKISQELDLLSKELKPVHSRLIMIKRELQSLINRKSSHSWSLMQVNNIQDELREIEKLKSDGKFCFIDDRSSEYTIPKGQALVFSLLETCYEDVHELLSTKDVLTMDNPLREVYEKLMNIRANLESHEMTFRWTLTPTSLSKIQQQLGEIDNMRVDGKFIAKDGSIPQGQAVLHFLLHKCYRLVRKLLTSMEPVSDELLPHYNQLLTLKKCLTELEKFEVTLSDHEILPYKMKLKSLENILHDTEDEEGKDVMNELLQESTAVLEKLAEG